MILFLTCRKAEKNKPQNLPKQSNRVIAWGKILFEKKIGDSEGEELSIVNPVHPSTKTRGEKEI